jgi:hypothetical protein
MSITAAQIQAFIEIELKTLNDLRITTHIRSLLVEPMPVLRGWDYGTPDQAYPCWAVLNHPQSNTGIAYCEFGFGPSAPWGWSFFQKHRVCPSEWTARGLGISWKLTLTQWLRLISQSGVSSNKRVTHTQVSHSPKNQTGTQSGKRFTSVELLTQALDTTALKAFRFAQAKNPKSNFST